MLAIVIALQMGCLCQWGGQIDSTIMVGIALNSVNTRHALNIAATD